MIVVQRVVCAQRRCGGRKRQCGAARERTSMGEGARGVSGVSAAESEGG